MKVFIKSATDRSNKMTQTKSQKFSSRDVVRKHNDIRRGETMNQIASNIFNDPDVTLGDADSEGNQIIFYKDQNVGWANKRRGIGDINNKVYTQIKHAAQRKNENNEEANEEDDE